MLPDNRFNPHFRKGSDRQAVCQLPFFLCFNPHFRKGSDSARFTAYVVTQVSIHTSAREVTYYDNDGFGSLDVSIHTSAREVTLQFIPCDKVLEVSIHTSAREVTAGRLDLAWFWWVSIHTSAREVTSGRLCMMTSFMFQSTLPQGKWHNLHLSILYKSVSIHTSAREVTTLCSTMYCLVLFQSTLPQGKWPGGIQPRDSNSWGFNPHFRKGSDLRLAYLAVPIQVSIHTSAREVTLQPGASCFWLSFQSTLPQGKWPDYRYKTSVVTGVSIHTSAREVTMSVTLYHFIWMFQSTLPQGKWLRSW